MSNGRLYAGEEGGRVDLFTFRLGCDSIIDPLQYEISVQVMKVNYSPGGLSLHKPDLDLFLTEYHTFNRTLVVCFKFKSMDII